MNQRVISFVLGAGLIAAGTAYLLWCKLRDLEKQLESLKVGQATSSRNSATQTAPNAETKEQTKGQSAKDAASELSTAVALPTAVKPASKPSSASSTQCIEVLLPDQCTESKVAYGGQLLAWIDIAGGITAFKHAGGPVVTAATDSVHFLAPARMGEIVRIRGRVLAAFKSSMEVGVTVEAENFQTGHVRRVCDALLVFVALGPNFKPTEVPALAPQTEEEKHDFQEAEKRRESRKKWRYQRQVIAQQLDDAKSASSSSALAAADDLTAFSLDKVDKEKSLAVRSGPTLRLERVPVSQTCIEMTEAVMPGHANSMGITFGGQVMKWMELACSMAACRLAKGVCLTASVDEMSFISSSKVGDLLVFKATVNRVFSTSMEVGVRVEAITLVNRGASNNTSRPVHCSSAYFTFIAVDARALRNMSQLDSASASASASASGDGKLVRSPNLSASPIARSSVRVPQVVAESSEEKRRWTLAGERRKRRLASKQAAVAAASSSSAK